MEALNEWQTGYVGKSMSLRAHIAYEKGLLPLKRITQKTLKDGGIPFERDYFVWLATHRYVTPSEWHHVGASFEEVDFYQLEEVVEQLRDLDIYSLYAEFQVEKGKEDRGYFVRVKVYPDSAQERLGFFRNKMIYYTDIPAVNCASMRSTITQRFTKKPASLSDKNAHVILERAGIAIETYHDYQVYSHLSVTGIAEEVMGFESVAPVAPTQALPIAPKKPQAVPTSRLTITAKPKPVLAPTVLPTPPVVKKKDPLDVTAIWLQSQTEQVSFVTVSCIEKGITEPTPAVATDKKVYLKIGTIIDRADVRIEGTFELDVNDALWVQHIKTKHLNQKPPKFCDVTVRFNKKDLDVQALVTDDYVYTSGTGPIRPIADVHVHQKFTPNKEDQAWVSNVVGRYRNHTKKIQNNI